jgi:hypothetical protein
MFELTLLDHLRLTYSQVVVRHRTHLQMAGWRAAGAGASAPPKHC